MSNVSQRNIRFTTLSLLVSLLLILAYTPLGFINIPPVSITTMHIPVIIGSIMLGPIYGAILGFSFDLISLIKASIGTVGVKYFSIFQLYVYNLYKHFLLIYAHLSFYIILLITFISTYLGYLNY